MTSDEDGRSTGRNVAFVKKYVCGAQGPNSINPHGAASFTTPEHHDVSSAPTPVQNTADDVRPADHDPATTQVQQHSIITLLSDVLIQLDADRVICQTLSLLCISPRHREAE